MIGISVSDSGALQACFGVSFAMKKQVWGTLFATKYTKTRQTKRNRNMDHLPEIDAGLNKTPTD